MKDRTAMAYDDDRLGELLRAALHEEAPPRAWVDRVIALRSPGRQLLRAAGATLRRLVAQRVPGGAGSGFAPAFGVRGGPGEATQMLYHAEECEVDLRLAPRADGLWNLRGQLFGLPAHTRVRLAGPAGEALAESGPTSEFAFDGLPPGAYRLVLDAGELEVVIPQIEVGQAASGHPGAG